MQWAELSPFIIPVVGMLIPIVAIICHTVMKVMRMQMLHETVKHLADRGQPIPPELLNSIISQK